ncbi:hypothetical protein PIB30_042876 [Stylosanthes scabra]|uniref:Uncharacterized protein n=1 Tax=Stylosanthes scabra TaxID=79078 RepID=A0ABU6ZE40_9FABA|nr:hypothetical protein [Stylosanthes scabra]
MHGLRLREALYVLFASIVHATNVDCWRNGGYMWPIDVKNIGCVCLDARWSDGNRVYALSLASRVDSSNVLQTPNFSKCVESSLVREESIRILAETKCGFLRSIRESFQTFYKVLLRDSSRLEPFQNRFKILQRPMVLHQATWNRFFPFQNRFGSY